MPAALMIGHDVEMRPAYTSTMGHAGAVVRHASGVIEGATDPRSDGAAMGSKLMGPPRLNPAKAARTPATTITHPKNAKRLAIPLAVS